MATTTAPLLKKSPFMKRLIKERELLLMSVPILLYKILFAYGPIPGLLMAFQDFKPKLGIFGSEWVGFKHFAFLFTNARFLRDIRNTLAMSVLQLVSGYVCAIILALLLNEVKNVPFKRVIQNISYLPHFLSWIIVAGIVSQALSTENGFINELLMFLGLIKEPALFLGNPDAFWGIVVGASLWKELGWNTIIYLAAMTAIDTTQYEAAEIDGANRYQKMWHITLPGIKSTVVILLIMSVGHILEAGFEIQYFLGNGLVIEKSEIIDIFVLRYGLQMNNFSLATAAGLFKTVVSIVLIAGTNYLAGKLGEEKLI
ncbi:sugar ABC transporter permease [Spirochaetia bacterium]|nr:sugar ABC transporter permease [Spirochaetia bacterium]